MGTSPSHWPDLPIMIALGYQALLLVQPLGKDANRCEHEDFFTDKLFPVNQLVSAEKQ